MLLRNPISSTKNLFRRTLRSFRSFFRIEPYQKLPKASPPAPYKCNNPHNYQDLEKFYSEFTQTWDSNNAKAKSTNNKVTSSTQRSEGIDESNSRSSTSGNVEKKQQGFSRSRSFSVAQKLKEIELMDVRDVDHVLDIEEVLHYYSRLTCPAYVDIVDKFFMDICTEFLASPTRPKFPSVRH